MWRKRHMLCPQILLGLLHNPGNKQTEQNKTNKKPSLLLYVSFTYILVYLLQ